MKRSRFSEEQIIGILKEHEAGVSVADLCCKHGVSDASIYKWKAKLGGMEVSKAKRLKTLEDEKTRLMKLDHTAFAATQKSRIAQQGNGVGSAGLVNRQIPLGF